MRRAIAALGCAAAVAVPAAADARTVRVETMAVGSERVLHAPAAVRLRERSVRVGDRRCRIGAATPLSVLAGLGLRLGLRDYGACGRRPRDAGGLYVTRVGPDREHGRGGWVYKVGRRAGTGAAADPSGPFGTGRRLRDGDRVLWFWCELEAGGCQRTLDARPERTTAAPGETLRVTVRGFDDAGKGVAVPGATVRLASAEAITGADGTATLIVPPASGAQPLEATHPAMVRAFPREVRLP